jgi:hypothetical protein
MIPNGVTVCDSTMLGTISESNMEDLREAWKYVHNKGRHVVYFVPHITTMMAGGACNTNG